MHSMKFWLNISGFFFSSRWIRQYSHRLREETGGALFKGHVRQLGLQSKRSSACSYVVYLADLDLLIFQHCQNISVHRYHKAKAGLKSVVYPSSFFLYLPGNGRNWVDQCYHEAKEEGALPFHEFLLGNQIKTTKQC